MINNDAQIGFTSSDLFCLPTLVMLDSFFRNNKSKYIFNFVFYDTSKETRNRFKKIIEENGCEYKEWKVNEELFKDFILLKRFGYTTYFRIVFPFIVDNNCKKLLWIDSDTVVNGSIEKLFKNDLTFALYGVNMPEKECLHRLGLSEEEPYVNCGVILYNVEKIKSAYSLENALTVFSKEKDKFTYVDQCFLNLFYRNDIGTIDSIYNDIIYRVNAYSKTQIEQKSKIDIILHFVGNIKPWKYLYDNKICSIYWKYGRRVYGEFYYFKWYVISHCFIIFSPIVKLIKKTRKVNI